MVKIDLRKQIEEKRITINKLSKDTGISRQALTSLANGETTGIQFETLGILADYFGVSPSALVVDDDSNKTLYVGGICHEKENLVSGFLSIEEDTKIYRVSFNVAGISTPETKVLYGVSLNLIDWKVDKDHGEWAIEVNTEAAFNKIKRTLIPIFGAKHEEHFFAIVSHYLCTAIVKNTRLKNMENFSFSDIASKIMIEIDGATLSKISPIDTNSIFINENPKQKIRTHEYNLVLLSTKVEENEDIFSLF